MRVWPEPALQAGAVGSAHPLLSAPDAACSPAVLVKEQRPSSPTGRRLLWAGWLQAGGPGDGVLLSFCPWVFQFVLMLLINVEVLAVV